MKHLSIIIGLIFSLNIAFSQVAPPNIHILRYNDNFNFVKKDTIKKGFNKLKHINIGKKATISFGGELREQYQYFENLNFGDVPPTSKAVSVGQLWHRAMAHSNIEIGSKVRIFTQLNSTFRFLNPNPLTPEIDENQLSLHQAFVDFAIHENWQLRIGRQELGYGNNRLLTFREGPNTRLAFDAAILKYKNAKRKIDILAITPVVSKQKIGDDVSFKETILGIYGTEIFVPKKIMLDYYALNFRSDSRKYNFQAGEENRYTLGTRIFSQQAKFNYELESTSQFGTFNDLKINAFAISADINYKLNSKNDLIIGVGGNYISGDKNRADKALNTYNLLYSKPSYGLAAPIGSSNIVNVNPYFKISPIKKLQVVLAVYFLQRQSNEDGTYSPGMAQVRPIPTKLFVSTEKSIGTQYAFETNYQLNKNIAFSIDGAYFVAGKYVQQTGKGLNTTYLSFKGGFRF